jgi:hypothetical protein
VPSRKRRLRDNDCPRDTRSSAKQTHSHVMYSTIEQRRGARRLLKVKRCNRGKSGRSPLKERGCGYEGHPVGLRDVRAEKEPRESHVVAHVVGHETGTNIDEKKRRWTNDL